jgi:hypothetical protein
MWRWSVKRWLPLVGRIVWGGCCACILVGTLKAYDGTPTSDAEVVLIYGMLVLSFPAGLIVNYGMAGISELRNLAMGTYLQTSNTSILLGWVSYVAAGYWQWFVLVPWMYRKAAEWLSRRP